MPVPWSVHFPPVTPKCPRGRILIGVIEDCLWSLGGKPCFILLLLRVIMLCSVALGTYALPPERGKADWFNGEEGYIAAKTIFDILRVMWYY